MKFLCDQMLTRLGRWLRAAGYDTDIVELPLADRAILEQAKHSNRLLITRDRHFLDIKDSEGIVIFLKSNHLEKCIEELSNKIEINWTLLPFSRCLLCNEILTNANDKSLIPPKVLAYHDDFWFCGKCNKIYWLGGHTENMLHQLQIWKMMKGTKRKDEV